MSAAHTPPRTFSEEFDGDESLGFFVRQGEDRICSLPGIGYADREHAKLIAAAPELLATLKKLVDRDFTFVDGVGEENIGCEDVMAARNAIDKATGEQL